MSTPPRSVNHVEVKTGPSAVLSRQRMAFLREGAPTLAQRRADLKKLRDMLIDNRTNWEAAVAADFGHRSHHETAMMELLPTVEGINYLSRNLRRFMRSERRGVGTMFRMGRARVEYQPLGVVGIISPWNYPVNLSFMPIATALAAGNRVMLKPSEISSVTSGLIHRLITQTFDRDQVSVIIGDASVAQEFSALPFDHLMFTGSTKVGRKVMRAASENLVPVTLELGGKSPVIVAPHQVTARAARRIAFGKLTNAGQTCVAPDYALVQENDLDAFTDAFSAATARLYPDGPDSTDYSTIVSDAHYDRLTALIENAREGGAIILPAGRNPDQAVNRIRTIAPTLILKAAAGMDVMQEEIFGPILPVVTYRTPDEAIAFINERPRPLALYYFGPEDYICRRVLSRTTSGNVGLNSTLLHVAQDDLPFGGVGNSGMGAYHGIEGFRRFSHAKGVFSQGKQSLADLGQPPYGKAADALLAYRIP